MTSSPASAKELFVLGRLSVRPTYGHEIMKTLAASRSDLWAELSDKHVYYILRKLERDGLVEVSSTQEGGRPARHMYALTARGAAEFERLLQSDALIRSTPYSEFDIVFGMLTYTRRLSPAEKSAVLETRAAHLLETITEAHAALAEAAESGAPRLSSRVFSKVAAVAEAELRWIEELRADIAVNGWPEPPRPASLLQNDPQQADRNNP